MKLRKLAALSLAAAMAAGNLAGSSFKTAGTKPAETTTAPPRGATQTAKDKGKPDEADSVKGHI